MNTGHLLVEDVPPPRVESRGCVVANAFSLISPGTERNTVQMAQKSLAGKARARPDLVKQVLESAKREGIGATVAKVRDRLDTIKPVGYSSAGVVVEAGVEANGFRPGDRVACAGGGYAVHAEVVYVPRNLCARIPDGVALDDAAFTTLGAIAMHGVRQAEAVIGDHVVVIGLGLVGQLVAQILKAAGCQVTGIDLNDQRCQLAVDYGSDRVAKPDDEHTGLQGADSVIVAASTSDSGPVDLAARLCRDRGRVVVVGAVGMELNREPFYAKEIELRLSRSYGPGRYDPQYEEQGEDYPIGYVRWTEQRNMLAFLDLLKDKRVSIERLATHRYPVDQAGEAYRQIQDNRDAMGVLIEYPESASAAVSSRVVVQASTSSSKDSVGIGFIGAGNFAQANLLPHLKSRSDAKLSCVVTRSGGNARQVAKKNGFASCSTDVADLFSDEGTDAVFVATRHGTHANLVAEGLRSGKHVFVEKPLALRAEELSDLELAWPGDRVLQVGFNRRFSPLTTWALDQIGQRSGPISLLYRVNAGPLDPLHWIHDPEEGGGRILGEVCHFVDFAHFVFGRRISRVSAVSSRSDDARIARGNVVVGLESGEGHSGSIAYFDSGDAGLEKERIELYRGGMTVVIDDFRLGWLYENGRKSPAKVPAGKGFKEEVDLFVDAIKRGSQGPISFEDLLHSTRATFAVEASLNAGASVDPDTVSIDPS